ncbi:EmrB/QacA subfamily drug resistance transporter [Rhodococcus sp. PvR044]|uniref:MFS transporter n=2 Tax=Rhodococcus TaxID=1827 RepID=UPI000BD580B6|nr:MULTISPECIES: MFS transporter [unclassified Rhodococcus (in: high G+C Gram-positive bacteria)]PTR43609.1 EmrB/QacA subfamily drug resistance transporter [Rhodococcus sp. OK611]SNX90954.1 drug resistance transporter, EmrB/QacA subfamily [Rhodococcus sp. OK270]
MARKWWTLIAVCTGVFMLLLDVTIVNVALPDIQREFGASLTDLQWVIDAYALTLAAFLLTAGTIADKYGRRLVFAVGLVVFTVGSLLCGVANSLVLLSVSRAVQGVGGAIMFATSLALLAGAFAPRERGVAFGVFGAVTGVAVAVGPVLGGALTSGLSWRWIFFVNLPIGIAALAVTLLRVDESRAPTAHRVDWAGCVTFSAALGALVFGLIRSHVDGWGSVTVAGSLIASVVLLVAFVVVEKTSAAPMLDLSLLRVPTFGGGLIAAWAISASLFSLLTYLVIFLQGIQGYSAVETGLRFLPLTLAIFVTAGVAGRLSDVVPVRWLIGPGFVLVAAGLWLMRDVDPAASWTQFVPGFLVAGAGAGLINPPLASTAVGVVEQDRAGMASGINSTFRQVGIATGVAALGSLLASRMDDSVRAALSEGPLAGRAGEFADAVSSGSTASAIGSLPPELRGLAAQAAGTGYAEALDSILLIGSVTAALAAIATLLLIRSRDFVEASGELESSEQEAAIPV